jgi:hypothetical protein
MLGTRRVLFSFPLRFSLPPGFAYASKSNHTHYRKCFSPYITAQFRSTDALLVYASLKYFCFPRHFSVGTVKVKNSFFVHQVKVSYSTRSFINFHLGSLRNLVDFLSILAQLSEIETANRVGFGLNYHNTVFYYFFSGPMFQHIH